MDEWMYLPIDEAPASNGLATIESSVTPPSGGPHASPLVVSSRAATKNDDSRARPGGRTTGGTRVVSK
jgi:hypothetical protein